MFGYLTYPHKVSNALMLQFDLSEGNEVGFRGARLRIIDASNTGIRYEVTRALE